MRQTLAICLALTLIAGSAPAHAQVLRSAERENQTEVIDLGRIGPSAPDEESGTAVLQQSPSKQAAIRALSVRANAQVSLGETYRITPRTLYNSHIGARLGCASSAFANISTYANNNSWSCEGGQDNLIYFEFRQLSPQTTYLVTIVQNYINSIDVITNVGGQQQKTTISPPPHPLFLVFETGAGQTTASITINKIRGGTYGAGGKFYSLELTKVQ